MALSGLEIYKNLPKTNCKECGFPTCLAFAMQLAAKKVSLDKCPHVAEAAKQALEGASAPPIKLVTIGTGDSRLEIGNETVMFRHEETFYHPAGVGFLVEDSLPADGLKAKVAAINKLKFERVGQEIGVDLIAVKHTGGDFPGAVKAVAAGTKLNLVLISEDAKMLEAAAGAVKDRRPLLYAANKDNFESMAKIAKDNSLPLAVIAGSAKELADLTQKIKGLGVEEIVMDTGTKTVAAKIEDLTLIRRMALKKSARALGYPMITFTTNTDPHAEAAEAASYVAKYSGIVIMKSIQPELVLSVLTVRQNIYTDPQKPVQVEPGAYEIGNVTDKSPVMVTTNFSITYYTVAGEVEASKIPSYIISVDAEGMSVLTAWAAEKFTPEKISQALVACGMKDKVSHQNVIIPGYVAVMSGKLEEDSKWKVLVGPREASGLPKYLREMGK